MNVNDFVNGLSMNPESNIGEEERMAQDIALLHEMVKDRDESLVLKNRVIGEQDALLDAKDRRLSASLLALLAEDADHRDVTLDADGFDEVERLLQAGLHGITDDFLARLLAVALAHHAERNAAGAKALDANLLAQLLEPGFQFLLDVVARNLDGQLALQPSGVFYRDLHNVD